MILTAAGGAAQRTGRPRGPARVLRRRTGAQIAKALAHRPAGEIKRVMRGVTTTEAVAAFARLWVSDEHWAAADKVMKRGK